jgi:hypothetical protein
MSEDTSSTFVALAISAVLITLIVGGGYLITVAMQNDLTIRRVCTEQGGVITYAGTCAWSKGPS